MYPNGVLKGCTICIDGNELSTNLVPLDVQEFDVILGMDFLLEYHASLDCHRKDVVFRQSGKAEVNFKGDR